MGDGLHQCESVKLSNLPRLTPGVMAAFRFREQTWLQQVLLSESFLDCDDATACFCPSKFGTQKSSHRFAWFVLLKGSGDRDGRDHGLGPPLVRILSRVNGQRAKVRELLVAFVRHSSISISPYLVPC